MLDTLFAVRVVEWMFSLLGLAGVAICVYTTLDAWADLRARARVGMNGDLKTAGHIARRAALASMMLHAGFLVVGLSAILGAGPPPRLYARSVMVGLLYVFMQLAVVFAQVRNQYDRNVIRARRSEIITTGEGAVG